MKVVDPYPVRKANVTLHLYKDGVLAAEYSANTNASGVASFRYRWAANAVYAAHIIGLIHNLDVWDQSEGMLSNSYTVNKMK